MAEGPHPLPWRTLAIFFVPFAALAAATGLQRFFEGPAPAGDAQLRWLLFASVAGLLIGGVTALVLGRTRRERYGWAALGVVGPWFVTVVATGLLLAAHKVEDRWALHELRACHASGRAICRSAEFRGACASAASRDFGVRAAALRTLGTPLKKDCNQVRCESRWSYDGPWGAEEPSARQTCSIITDPAGHGARWMLLADER